MKKLVQKLSPLKKTRLSKKSQKEEDEVKKKLTEDNQYWNDWKFQIHWNELGCVNPRNRNERKNPFCVSSKKNNPDLFQEEEEQESKEANYDANLNSEADEIYETTTMCLPCWC